MGDPSMIPDPTDVANVAKVTGGGGLGAALVLVLTRFFKKSDDEASKQTATEASILAQLTAIQTSLNTLSRDVAVMASANNRTAQDIIDLKAAHTKEMEKLEERMDKLLERVSKLEGHG